MATLIAHCEFHPTPSDTCHACQYESMHAERREAVREMRREARFTWYDPHSQRSQRDDRRPGPGWIPTHIDGQRLHTMPACELITGIAKGHIARLTEQENVGIVVDAGATAAKRYLTDADLRELGLID